jgi:hypothetical protein
VVKPEEDDKQFLIALSDAGGSLSIYHSDSHRSVLRLVDLGWATSRKIERATVYSLTPDGVEQAERLRSQRER